MNHTIAFTVAPVVTVFDDRGEIIQAVVVPLAFVFGLPCALWLGLVTLYLLAAGVRRAGVSWLAHYIAGWRADLDLIGQAAWLLLFPRGKWGHYFE
jgi:hypothetical protein